MVYSEPIACYVIYHNIQSTSPYGMALYPTCLLHQTLAEVRTAEPHRLLATPLTLHHLFRMQIRIILDAFKHVQTSLKRGLYRALGRKYVQHILQAWARLAQHGKRSDGLGSPAQANGGIHTRDLAIQHSSNKFCLFAPCCRKINGC